MKKILTKLGNLTLGIGIGIGLSLGIQGFANIVVNLGTDSAIQYIKKIFLTTDGTNKTTTKISLDGSNGNISMSGSLRVYGSTNIGGTLGVGSNTSIGGSLSVNGNINVRDAIYDSNDGDVNIGSSSKPQDLKLSRNLYWGSKGALIADQGASIELGGSGTPYIDFKNDLTSDYDMRIRLINNDQLAIEGGSLLIKGPLYLGTTIPYPYLAKSTNNSIIIRNSNGYIQIGPQNTTYSHFYTDRSAFYFNKKMWVNGSIKTTCIGNCF